MSASGGWPWTCSKMNRLGHWIPLALLCAAIFIQSSFPSPDLGPSFPLKDKVLHFLAYGLMAALCFRTCRLTWPARFGVCQMLIISILFASLFGLSDEWHQSFVAARQAELLDLSADMAGSVLGGLLAMRAMHGRGCRQGV